MRNLSVFVALSQIIENASSFHTASAVSSRSERRRTNGRFPQEQTVGSRLTAEALFSNRSKIRHVADFPESTLGFADRDLPQDRDRPVYSG